ncbi:MAG: hypothetical protein MASP_01627 [Candidatus Methanolliviera sp. GoM_asphalt]|nr:MAG: hypothetical protein MASP_01627 [Candidatus Methanolliviera sp. GoM_asphalt]
MERSFEDFFRRVFFYPYKTEEVRRKRRELEETEEMARIGYRRKTSLMPRRDRNTFSIPKFLESPEVFEEKVTRWAKEHPDYQIDVRNVTFPNGYYRSVEIKSEGKRKRRSYRDG